MGKIKRCSIIILATFIISNFQNFKLAKSVMANEKSEGNKTNIELKTTDNKADIKQKKTESTVNIEKEDIDNIKNKGKKSLEDNKNVQQDVTEDKKLKAKLTASNKLQAQTLVNTVEVIKNGSKNMLKVWGYAVNKPGVEKVKVYLDNKYLGLATIGLARPDVAWKLREYPNGDKSGYLAQLYIPDGIESGDKQVKVVAVGKDESSKEASSNVFIKAAPQAQTAINTAEVLRNGAKNMIKVWGYAVNPSQVKEVRVYLDNKYLGLATTGLTRPDVAWKFREYPNGDKSGYLAQLNIPDTMDSGNKTLRVVAVGKNGSTKEVTKNVSVKAILKPQAEINTAEVLKSGSKNMVKVWGYTVNPSGIKEVRVYINNSFIGNATTGLARQDIAWKLREYPNGDKSGYLAQLNIPSYVGTGNKTLKVVTVGKDGTSKTAVQNIRIKEQLTAQTIISTLSVTQSGGKNMVKVWGYAVNPSGIKEIKVYVNNTFIGNATADLVRNDVAWKFKDYPNGNKSGYLAQLNIPSYVGTGRKTLKVVAVGKNGTTKTASRDITIKSKLIVVDPGHLGHDSGACAYGRRESDLNSGIAVKLQKELQNRGYRTYMTRSPLHPYQYSYLSVTNELKQRTDVANSLHADLFISLHHDVAGSSSSGMWTFYSSWKPGVKNTQSDLRALNTGYDGTRDVNPSNAGKISREFAQKVLNQLTSRCGYPAVRPYAVDRNLYVTVHTNMPAVLIELGMMTNRSELNRCLSYSGQAKKASVIASTVQSMF